MLFELFHRLSFGIQIQILLSCLDLSFAPQLLFCKKLPSLIDSFQKFLSMIKETLFLKKNLIIKHR